MNLGRTLPARVRASNKTVF